MRALYKCVCVCVCGFERAHVSQPICMEIKWNDRSSLRQGHCYGRYCWVSMVCCWGFDSVIWPSGDLANLFFSLSFPSSLQFLLRGSILLLFFHLSFLIVSLRLKSLSLTLKLALNDKSIYFIIRCRHPDCSKGTLSTLFMFGHW